MSQSQYSLDLIESAQAYSLLAFAVSVGGPNDGFPAVLGVSAKNRQVGVIDLSPQQVDSPGTVVCLIEHPEALADIDDTIGYPHYCGEITFALWADSSFGRELARITWRVWRYADLGSLDPSRRIDPISAGRIEDEFTSMRQRYTGAKTWAARKVGHE